MNYVNENLSGLIVKKSMLQQQLKLVMKVMGKKLEELLLISQLKIVVEQVR